MVFNYRTRAAVGLVSESIASNAAYWREMIFPFALGLMSPVLGNVPLHAACVLHRGSAILIGARSGAGKSTLAAALAKRGLAFISDDWAYLNGDRGLRVFSSAVKLKLLPDAARFFPELQSSPISPSQNGEQSFQVDPVTVFGASRVYECTPRTVILFDRIAGAKLSVRRATAEDVVDLFSEPLDCIPDCLSTWRDEQLQLLRRLSACSTYVVTTDGTPDAIAADLLRVCDGEVQPEPAAARDPVVFHLPEDLLRRGIPAPHQRVSEIDGVTVNIATNSQIVEDAFEATNGRIATFAATILTEPAVWGRARNVVRYNHGPGGFISLGRDGLIAFDADYGEVAAFVSATAVRNGRLHSELARLCNRSVAVAGSAM